MVTDPARVRRTDRGNPDVCPRGRPAQNIQRQRNDREGKRRLPVGGNRLHRMQELGRRCPGKDPSTPCRSAARNTRTIRASPGIFWKPARPVLVMFAGNTMDEVRSSMAWTIVRTIDRTIIRTIIRTMSSEGFHEVTDLSQPTSKTGSSRGFRARRGCGGFGGDAASRVSYGRANPRPSPPKDDASDFPFAVELGEIYEGPPSTCCLT